MFHEELCKHDVWLRLQVVKEKRHNFVHILVPIWSLVQTVTGLLLDRELDQSVEEGELLASIQTDSLLWLVLDKVLDHVVGLLHHVVARLQRFEVETLENLLQLAQGNQDLFLIHGGLEPDYDRLECSKDRLLHPDVFVDLLELEFGDVTLEFVVTVCFDYGRVSCLGLRSCCASRWRCDIATA